MKLIRMIMTQQNYSVQQLYTDSLLWSI